MSGMTEAELFGQQPIADPAPRAAPPALAPLPQEPDQSLIARAMIAEGDPNHPESWRNVGGSVLNRMAKSGKSAADILAEPRQFEAYGNGRIQSVDTNTPEFQRALALAQTLKPGDVPYDSFYQPDIVRQRNVKPPFDPKDGTRIGTQLFGNAYGGNGPPAGLTPDEQAKWDALQTPAATQPGGSKPGSGAVLVEGKPVTSAQEAWVKAHPDRIGGEAVGGTSALPFFLKPGGNIPQTPNSHYVDLDGVEHVVPGGVMGALESAGQGLVQGIGPDVLHSALKLTEGGLATAGVPFSAAPQGPDSDQQMREGALAAAARQAHDYSAAHMGDEAAQGGRFVGQAIPATAAAAAVPEVELPGAAATNALGMVSRVAGRTGTNALRGVAGVSPTVGPTDAPVGQQLMAGAGAGVLIPPAVAAGAKAGAGLMGLGGSATPEVAALADLAINKYKIPLRSGQIAGVGDRAAAYRDSNLLTAPGAGTAGNYARQFKAFTQAVSRTVGLDTPNLTPEAMDVARRRIGGVFEDQAQRTGMKADDQLFSDIAQIGSQARELGLDQSQINAIDLQIKKIADLAASHGDIIPGDAYQSITQRGSSLSRIMHSEHGSFADLASDFRGALDDAVARGASRADVDALQNARFQWKNLKTIQPLAAKAGPDGYISPTLLRSRVMAQFPNFAFGEGGDLGELARIGQTFMKEPPQSGTVPRLMDAFRGSAGSGLTSGAIAGLLSHDPGVGVGAALAPYALGAARVGNNALRGVLNDNPVATGLLLRGGQPPGPVGSALRGIGNLARPTQVPLSALGTDWLLNHHALSGAEAPVGPAQ